MIPRGKFFIDRIEGGRAIIIHRGGDFSIPLELLPPDATEGDFLELKITIDEESRKATGDDVAELQQRLRGKDGEEQDSRL